VAFRLRIQQHRAMSPPKSRHRAAEGAMTTAFTVETPESLMRDAIEGRLSKDALVSLLAPESRPAFLDACAAVERRLTDACASADDPCLESGCSCEGEVCLQPTLRAGSEYLKACGAEWVKLFADEQNRSRTWKVMD
jgi:hypothetical protein